MKCLNEKPRKLEKLLNYNCRNKQENCVPESEETTIKNKRKQSE